MSEQPPELAWAAFSLRRTPPNHAQMEFLYALSQAEFTALSRATRDIAESTEGVGTFLTQALADLEATAVEVQQSFNSGSLRPRNAHALFSAVTYRVVAFSAAVRMFEEYVQARINRTFGAKSSERSQSDAAFSQVYDTSLAYRVMYALRNAVVHGSSGLVTMKSHIALVDPTNTAAGVRGSLAVLLSREGFAERSRIKASVRQEVAQLEAAPDLLVFAREVHARLQLLEESLFQLVFPAVPAAIDLLKPHFLLAWAAETFAPNLHEYEAKDPLRFTDMAITEPVARVVIEAFGGKLAGDGSFTLPRVVSGEVAALRAASTTTRTDGTSDNSEPKSSGE